MRNRNIANATTLRKLGDELESSGEKLNDFISRPRTFLKERDLDFVPSPRESSVSFGDIVEKIDPQSRLAFFDTFIREIDPDWNRSQTAAVAPVTTLANGLIATKSRLTTYIYSQIMVGTNGRGRVDVQVTNLEQRPDSSKHKSIETTAKYESSSVAEALTKMGLNLEDQKRLLSNIIARRNLDFKKHLSTTGLMYSFGAIDVRFRFQKGADSILVDSAEIVSMN